jgi:hypothetical protein
MPSAVIANKNSYVTIAEADTYLQDSVRAYSAWDVLDDDGKARALITALRRFEKMRWQGDPAEVSIVDTVTVTTGGTGYAADDVLTVSGGTGVAARVTVLTVAAGVVQTVQLLDAGLYSVEPTSPVAVTGGTGNDDCTLTLTFTDQVLHFPASGVSDRYGSSVESTTVPDAIKDGLMEYAYELSQSSSLEKKAGTGTNTKRLKADVAEIEYFRPTGGVNGVGSQPFPTVVQELVGQFLETASLTLPYVGGSTVESEFDDDTYTLTEGYP